MAAIVDNLKKFANFVVDSINGEDSPFGSLNEPEEDDGYYVEDGNAVRVMEPQQEQPIIERHEAKVLNHPSINRGGNEIIVVEPRSFDDAATIVQHLKDRKIVMINLHLLEKAQSQRTIDLVCGAALALNGNPKKVGEGMFVFAPSNVVLSTDSNGQQNKFDDSLWRASLQ